jgi:hypothetical protein
MLLSRACFVSSRSGQTLNVHASEDPGGSLHVEKQSSRTMFVVVWRDGVAAVVGL